MRSKLLLVTVLLWPSALGTPCRADPPYAPLCDVSPQDLMANRQRLYGIPDAPTVTTASSIMIRLRDQYGYPCANWRVEIQFLEMSPHVCRCDYSWPSEVTGPNGVCHIDLELGGCDDLLNQAVIVAYETEPEYYLIRAYDLVVSCDFDGIDGDCKTLLSDFTVFSSAYMSHQYHTCQDYDGFDSECITFLDFMLFGAGWGRLCAPSHLH